MTKVAFWLVSQDWAVTTGRSHGLENMAWQRDQCQQRDRTKKVRCAQVKREQSHWEVMMSVGDANKMVEDEVGKFTEKIPGSTQDIQSGNWSKADGSTPQISGNNR